MPGPRRHVVAGTWPRPAAQGQASASDSRCSPMSRLACPQRRRREARPQQLVGADGLPASRRRRPPGRPRPRRRPRTAPPRSAASTAPSASRPGASRDQAALDGGFQAPGVAVAADGQGGVAELEKGEVHSLASPTAPKQGRAGSPLLGAHGLAGPVSFLPNGLKTRSTAAPSAAPSPARTSATRRRPRPDRCPDRRGCPASRRCAAGPSCRSCGNSCTATTGRCKP